MELRLGKKESPNFMRLIVAVLAISGALLIYMSGAGEGDELPPVTQQPTVTPTLDPVTPSPAPTMTMAPTATEAPSVAYGPTPEAASPTRVPFAIRSGYSVQSFNYKGARREYGLYIPPSYNDLKAIPMLVALHPLNANTEIFAIGLGWLAPAQEKQIIGVYPQGVITPNENGASWNALHCCGYAQQNNVDDIGFIRALITNLKSRYNIDAKRIYAAGYSNGGDMAHYVASEMSDVFAAAGEFAGAIGSSVDSPQIAYRPPKNRISFIKVHGYTDGIRPIGGGWDMWHAMQYVSANEAIKFWAQANGCVLTPTVSKIEEKTWEVYDGCKANTSVALVHYDVGHVYPPSATKVITEFLFMQVKQ
jgi:polyhydroxybutyrate depolymerase